MQQKASIAGQNKWKMKSVIYMIEILIRPNRWRTTTTKRFKNTEENLSDPQDYIKCTNIRKIGVSEEKRERRVQKLYLKK